MRNTLLLFPFMLAAFAGFGQDESRRRGSRVIDDTTKQVYGPNTSRYFYERDVFFNRIEPRPIDTLINNFHRYNYVQRNNNLYQDLGIIGSAIQPIFYRQPDVIGRRSGAHVYDLYWDAEELRYYDTKSPYTNMRVILGGRGRSITRAAFSRNINPRWNFGFTYRGLFIDRQILYRKNDRFLRSNYYDGYTSYQNKDSTYHLLANIRRGFHRAEEFGGVRLPSDTLPFSDYFEENVQPWLQQTETNDLRINLHLFHQYKVGEALQAYHVFDRYRQKNSLVELRSPQSEEFYDFVEIPNDSVRDITKFKTVRNEFGVKGSIAKLFWNGYYALRHYHLDNVKFRPDTVPHITNDSLHIPTHGTEHYLGGRISLFLDSIGQVTGGLEVMREGNYQVYGEIRSKWFEARLRQTRYMPGFVEQAYRGSYDVWNNNFGNIESTRLNGYLHYRSSTVNLSPGLTFTRVKNYVYYKKVSDVDTVQQVLPRQSTGTHVIASPEVRLSMTFFRHLTFSTQAIYTRLLENPDQAMSVPELFVNTQLSYANIFFKGNFDFQTGVDVHWRSDYYAMGYDVATRQFYVQDEVISPAFPIVDVFISAKVKRGRVFFKYHNMLQIVQGRGTFPTPYYPSQRSMFDFGFDWSFYD